MMDYDIRHGRTYMYFKDEPLYPFGYGLSYTTFRYSNLRLNSTTLKSNGQVQISFDLTNTGKRFGEEVVQLYVKYLDSKVSRPLKELKRFSRVAVRAGETKRVSLSLKGDQLAYWNVDAHRFEVEPGNIEIRIGSSSADVKLKKIVRVEASTSQ